MSTLHDTSMNQGGDDSNNIKKISTKRQNKPKTVSDKKTKKPKSETNDETTPKNLVKTEKKKESNKNKNRKGETIPMGINISPAKVKNIISNYVLNKKSYTATVEIKSAMPKKITKTIDGKEVVEEYKGTPVNQLSKETLEYVSYANDNIEQMKHTEFVKNKLSTLTPQQKKEYNKLKNKERDDVESKGESTFDIRSFNKKYDPNFYESYKPVIQENNVSEWKLTLDHISKLKQRFSTNSRVFVSAFVDCIIKQLVTHSLFNCVADKKKSIRLSHVFDTSKDGFKDRCLIYPLLVNLNVFKQAQKYLSESELKKDENDESSKDDIFTVDGLEIDKQYQFRYYISELCKEIKLDLSNKDVDNKANYTSLSISKIFKNFCSSLVCELLMNIGRMIVRELETRYIKTVNDAIVSVVISHFHIVCGVDEKHMIDSIKNAIEKYYVFISTQQETRKETKKNKVST